LIEGSDTDDFDEGSLPELLDGSDFNERDQNFEDRQTELDASVAYVGIPFGSVLSPQELLRRREEYETHLNMEDLGLSRVAPLDCTSVVYRGLSSYSWLVPHV
jgi:hypothetical protein